VAACQGKCPRPGILRLPRPVRSDRFPEVDKDLCVWQTLRRAPQAGASSRRSSSTAAGGRVCVLQAVEKAEAEPHRALVGKSADGAVGGGGAMEARPGEEWRTVRPGARREPPKG
jgi:hypothetical protein